MAEDAIQKEIFGHFGHCSQLGRHTAMTCLANKMDNLQASISRPFMNGLRFIGEKRTSVIQDEGYKEFKRSIIRPLHYKIVLLLYLLCG